MNYDRALQVATVLASFTLVWFKGWAGVVWVGFILVVPGVNLALSRGASGLDEIRARLTRLENRKG